MTDSPIIRLSNVSKCYRLFKQQPFLARELFRMLLQRPSAVDEHWALTDISFEVGKGESIGVVGRNGAGKSTLIKTLSGAHTPDAGQIVINGQPVTISDPVAAKRAGIAVIYQEFNLIPALSARENIFLGRENTTGGFVHQREEHRLAVALFERIGVHIDPEVPCSRLSVAQQQIVEIAKALSVNARILVMDEPSATLTPPAENSQALAPPTTRRRPVSSTTPSDWNGCAAPASSADVDSTSGVTRESASSAAASSAVT